MRRMIIAAMVGLALLFGAVMHGGAPTEAEPTMHNCPTEGTWALSVYTGPDGADVGEALATCPNIVEGAYVFKDGVTLRYFPDFESNTLERFNDLDAVITLGGEKRPVVEEPTNVSIIGTLPEGCTPELLTVAERSAGDGERRAYVSSLHDKPFASIEQTDDGTLYSETYKQMARIVEFTLLCNDEVLTYADVPEASGSDHAYTIEVLVTGNDYEVLPRQHEYLLHDCGRRADGTIFYCRGFAGEKIPPNPTCPPPARWEIHNDQAPVCPGHPFAIYGAYYCDNPPDDELYCNIFDR